MHEDEHTLEWASLRHLFEGSAGPFALRVSRGSALGASRTCALEPVGHMHWCQQGLCTLGSAGHVHSVPVGQGPAGQVHLGPVGHVRWACVWKVSRACYISDDGHRS